MRLGWQSCEACLASASLALAASDTAKLLDARSTSTLTADAQVFHVTSGHWDHHKQRIHCCRMELTQVSSCKLLGIWKLAAPPSCKLWEASSRATPTADCQSIQEGTQEIC